MANTLASATRLARTTLIGLVFSVVSQSAYASCLPEDEPADTLDVEGEVTPTPIPMPLETAIRRALSLDPRVGKSWAEIRARAAEIGIARADYLPSVNADSEFSYESEKSSAYGNDDADRSPSNGGRVTGQWRINVSWLLLDFGARESRTEMARHRLAVATALGDDALQQVIFDTAHAYYAALDAQARLRSARRIERLSRQSTTVACARFDAGAGALADVLRARTAHDRHVLARLEASAAAIARSGDLASLIGADMGAVLVLNNDSALDAYEPGSLAPLDALLAQLRDHHPLLRKAYADVLTEEAGRDAVRSDWGPSLRLVADVNRGTQSGSFAGDRGRLGASIGVQLSIPLYDGGLRQHRVKKADALVDMAKAGLLTTERRVLSRVWQSHRALRALSMRRTVESRLVDDAKHSYDIARGRYQAGVSGIEELIGAQSAWADAEHVVTASRARWNVARLTLLGSLGQLNVEGIGALARVSTPVPWAAGTSADIRH